MHSWAYRIELLKDFKMNGNLEAFNKLVNGLNKIILLRAHKILRSMPSLREHLDDLIQEGNEATIKAIHTCQSYGAFPKYCVMLIKSSQWKYVKRAYIIDTKLDSVSRRCNRKLFFKIRTLLDITDEQDPDVKNDKRKEFANNINLPMEDILEAELRVVLMYNRRQVNEDLIPSYANIDIEEYLDHQLLEYEVQGAVGRLDEKYKVIIKDRFFSDNPKTLRAMGKELGCDKLTVNARRKAGLLQLRKMFRNNQVIRELVG